jgi:Zn-dependent protease
MLPTDPASWIARLVIIFIGFPIHEFAHAWTATRFGDDTPRLQGRLTLNPLAHIDVMGALLVLVAGFGWAKPVQVNPYALNRRSSSAMMWVSLAGPLSNLLLAILAATSPAQAGGFSHLQPGKPLEAGFHLATAFILINLPLMLFNLMLSYWMAKVLISSSRPTWHASWIKPPLRASLDRFVVPLPGDRCHRSVIMLYCKPCSVCW